MNALSPLASPSPSPLGPPPAALRPLLARLTAKPGPPETRIVSRAGATVVAVPGRYSVTYLLVGPASVVVVDIGSSTDHARIIDALAWLGRPLSQVRGVMPTHLHMDHIIGIDGFARRLDVPILLGHVAYEAVTRGRKLSFPRGLHLLRAIPTYVMQGAPRGALADWRVGLEFGFPWSKNRFSAPLIPCLETDSSVLGLPGWTVMHTPGHADDAICLHHAAAGFLVAGDTVRNFSGGEWNPLGSDPRAYARSKQRLLELTDVQTIFPGHGPLIEGPQVLQRLRTLPPWAP